MPLSLLYVLALACSLPVGFALWFATRRVFAWEPLALCAGFLVIAGLTHMAVSGTTRNDTQLLHGAVKSAEFTPAWREWYEEAVYRTEYYSVTVVDGDGRSHTERRSREVFDHWSPETRWHGPEWTESDTFGGTEIDEARWNSIAKAFGKVASRVQPRSTGEHNSRQIEGDRNVYTAVNVSGVTYPVHVVAAYENRVIMNQSLFGFQEPQGYKPPVAFPVPSSRFDCRLALGSPGWDDAALQRVNAALGPIRKVNLMCVGFGNQPMQASFDLQAHWKGGKRNDVVLCFGGPREKPTWTRCFGWSESLLVFRNLESMTMREGMTPKSLELARAEIVNGYKIKDWGAFDYLPLHVSFWWAFGAVILMGVSGVAWWMIAVKDRRFVRLESPVDVLFNLWGHVCDRSFVTQDELANPKRRRAPVNLRDYLRRFVGESPYRH